MRCLVENDGSHFTGYIGEAFCAVAARTGEKTLKDESGSGNAANDESHNESSWPRYCRYRKTCCNDCLHNKASRVANARSTGVGDERNCFPAGDGFDDAIAGIAFSVVVDHDVLGGSDAHVLHEAARVAGIFACNDVCLLER